MPAEKAAAMELAALSSTSPTERYTRTYLHRGSAYKYTGSKYHCTSMVVYQSISYIGICGEAHPIVNCRWDRQIHSELRSTSPRCKRKRCKIF